MISSTGMVTTIAGRATGVGILLPGSLSSARLALPVGITNPTPAGDVIVSSANAVMQLTAFEAH
jgi:hypothetical protein